MKLVLVALIATAQLLVNQPDLQADDVVKPVKPAETKLSQKPVWLTELSIGIKESFDDNIFLAGAPVLSSYTVPAGSVAAVKNISSFVTTISPKIGVDFVPLLGNQGALQSLTLSYAPDFVFYHEASSENYDNHRVIVSTKGKMDDFSFQMENVFNYINGSDYGAIYPGNYRSVYSYAPSRERREQLQNRNTVTFRYDQEKWFVRPTSSLLYYDLDTVQLAGVTGYQNYADRYDVNGGADLGYKLNKDLAVTVGYRYGFQYQQTFSSAIDLYNQSADNVYQRALLGIEGKPFNWLEIKIQGGPDFRRYAHSALVRDQSPTTYYGEAVITATITKQDTITFNYRQWQWIASTGCVPYFDSTYDLNYSHKFNDKLSGNLGLRLLGADYTSDLTYNNTAHTPATACTYFRNDLEYTISAGVRYAFNAHLSAELSYAHDLGRNAIDGLANPDYREFDHQLFSIGLQTKF